ncbi:MAG: hypothetical protein KGJ52_11910 [Gammaproteobacteria bacterium]|nr:hypothetical protein [Gammaproteobacteria bacterium]
MNCRGTLARAAVLLSVATATLAVTAPAPCATAAPPASTAAPATSATWKAIDDNLQQLDALIHAGRLGDLGHAAYGIANLFKTLPAQSAALPAGKRALISNNVKVVGALVSRLDKAGESGNKAAVDAGLKSLKDTLAPLRAIYASPAAN